MNEYFKGIFNEIPFEIINDDYYFNADKDGDSFDESDADLWLKEVFRNSGTVQYKPIMSYFNIFMLMFFKHTIK